MKDSDDYHHSVIVVEPRCSRSFLKYSDPRAADCVQCLGPVGLEDRKLFLLKPGVQPQQQVFMRKSANNLHLQCISVRISVITDSSNSTPW